MTFTSQKLPTGDYVLKVDGMIFGHLRNCEVAYIFSSDDEMLYNSVVFEGGMSLAEMLTEVKRAYIDLQAYYDGEAKAERAYYNMIETNDEHREEMEREDAMGLS